MPWQLRTPSVELRSGALSRFPWDLTSGRSRLQAGAANPVTAD